MRTPACGIALLFILLGVAPAAENETKDGLGHERLMDAYQQVSIASDLARGKPAQSAEPYLKEAKEMPDARLRSEIKVKTDQIQRDFPQSLKVERLEIATHLYMARLIVTTNEKPTYELVRSRLDELARAARSEGKGFNPEDYIRKFSEAINVAVKAQ